MDPDQSRPVRLLKRGLVGTERRWGRFVAVASVIAILSFIWASQSGHEIVNLLPDDHFEWTVMLSSVILAGYVGYRAEGLVLAWLVAGVIWFGSLYYGATTPGWDHPAPGPEFALLVAGITAICYGTLGFSLGVVSRSIRGPTERMVRTHRPDRNHH